jgi:hypothetical protein
VVSSTGGVQENEKPAAGHEFAYEASESAHKRTDAVD